MRELKIGFEIMLKTNYQRITEIIFFLLLTATTAEAQPNIESEFKTLPKAGDVNFNSPTSEEIRRKRISSVMTVVNNCTNCHSAKLVIQNRMNKERWLATIKWMQETQGLWDLRDNQEIIVNYLVTNYPPIEKGRRENLTNIEWYEIEN